MFRNLQLKQHKPSLLREIPVIILFTEHTNMQLWWSCQHLPHSPIWIILMPDLQCTPHSLVITCCCWCLRLSPESYLLLCISGKKWMRNKYLDYEIWEKLLLWHNHPWGRESDAHKNLSIQYSLCMSRCSITYLTGLCVCGVHLLDFTAYFNYLRIFIILWIHAKHYSQGGAGHLANWGLLILPNYATK